MKKQVQKNIDWNKQMVDTVNALVLIADEHNIPRDTVADALKDAIIKAYTKEYPETQLEVNIDIDNKQLHINQLFKVVEDHENFDDYVEITLEDAKKHNPNIQLGDTYKKPIHISELSKLSLGLFLSQNFKHNVTSESNKQIYNTWKPRIGEVIYAEVEKFDAKMNIATVNLGGTFGFVGRNESIPGEILQPGHKYNFYVKDVKEQTKGWPIILSRSDAGLVKYLLSLNIPEIQENIIEIKDIARVAGFKTKLSVVSHQASVEAAGTVIGPRGSRIKTIQEQISGEHIEVIEYDDDFKRYIVNVCAPAEIIGFAITEPTTPEERREITLIASSEKLALLIGKKGSNVRLISEMLKANIEVSTVEEAHQDGVKYEKVDTQQLRRQPFARAYNKYHVGRDIMSQYNKTKPIRFDHTSGDHKKNKTSILDDFKGMDKADLMKELSNVDTNDRSDDIDNEYDE